MANDFAFTAEEKDRGATYRSYRSRKLNPPSKLPILFSVAAVALLGIGLTLLAKGMSMDTTVVADYGDRIHNIGLLAKSQTYTNAGIGVALLGAFAVIGAIITRNKR